MKNKDDKKNTENSYAATSGIDPEIEKRVDAMLSLDIPDKPEPAPKPSKKNKKEEQPAPIDIFAGVKSAPEVSPELISQMTEAIPEPAAADAPEIAEDKFLVKPPRLEDIQDSEAIPDPETDKAVEAIIKEEGDAILDAEDGKTKKNPTVMKEHVNPIKRLFKAWWHNKWARSITVVIILAAIVAVAIMPTTRYGALNLVGVKATASVTVLDGTTKLPLKDVSVTLGTVQALTNKSGVATLAQVPLGTQTVTIHKVAFSTINETVVVGLGTNTLTSESLKAVGDQYQFMVTDYVSGSPVITSSASAGAASAISDKSGKIILTSAATTDTIKVTINADGYRPETVTVPVGSTTTTAVQLVTATPDIFVSKASGNYDVYKANIDGQNRQVILKGSGLETTTAFSLIPHPTDPVVAVVSTRDNLRNADGYLLGALNIVNVSNAKTLTIDHAEKIQLVGWSGNKIVYVRIKAGTSAGSPERYQLESYDYKTTQTIELAHANNFSDVVSAKGSIYYAASNDYQGGTSIFAKVNADGTGKATLLTAEVYNIFWPDYDDFNLSAASQTWYSYHIGTSQATKLSATPPTTDANKVYIASPDSKQAAWVEPRDGQGVLSVHNVASNKDTVLVSAVGLSYPLRWLDNTTLIYRVVSPTETADYVVSTLGGTPKKVTDLTDVSGAGRWYYYQSQQ